MSYLIVFVVSIIGTIMIRRFAIFDTPNERSAHSVAVPTGGGLAIVLAFYLGLFMLFFQGLVPERLFFALLGGLVLVLVSFIDDMMELSPNVRILAQFVSLMIAFHFLEVFTSFAWYQTILFLLSALWLINLYNFLDGIDGYAGSEGVFVSLGAFVLYHDTLFNMMSLAIVGFLLFNWQRASIFMGDVGSTFIGFFFGVMALYHYHDSSDIMIWGILLSIFIFDATLTLLRRALRREKLSLAHKKHYFQRVVQSGYSHQKTVLLAMLVNLFFFIPLYLLKESSIVIFLLVWYTTLLFLISKIIDRKRPFV